MDILSYDTVAPINNSLDPMTVGITVGNYSNRVLIVGIAIQTSNHGNMPIVGVSSNVNGAFTKWRSDESTSNVRTEIWYLLNPTVGAHTISIDKTAAVYASAGVISLYGASQISSAFTGTGGVGTGTTASIAPLVTYDNSWVIDVICHEDGAETSSLGTIRWNVTGTATQNGAGATTSITAGTQYPTIKYTLAASAAWAMTAIVIPTAGTVPIYDSVKYYIDSVDRTDYVCANSLSITDNLGAKVNTATFRTYDIARAFVPTNSSEIIIYDVYGNKIFGGIIVSTEEKRRANNPGTGTELLEYSVSCQDYTRLLQKKLIVETFEDMTCLEIITAIRDGYFSSEEFTLNNVETGPTVTHISFNYKTGDQALENLAVAVGYQWYIDYDKDIHFYTTSGLDSYATFTDSTDNWNNLIIKPDKSQLRNRVYVRGGIYYSDPFTQSIEADGVQEEYLLAYTPDFTGFSVTIASVSKSVGTKGVDDAVLFDFLLNRKEKTLSMGETSWAIANTPLAADTVLEVTYNYEIPVLIVQEDSDSITAMKALEGGDGIYEYLITDKNITSVSAARDRASAELRDYANPITRGSIESYDVQGVQSGNVITINSTRRGINADYLITTVKATQITQTKIRYTLDFTGKLYNFVDWLVFLWKQNTQVVLGIDEILDAFMRVTDAYSGIIDGTPVQTVSAPPFKWSNDAGSTTNKMRWNLFEWATSALEIYKTEVLTVQESVSRA